MNKSRTLLLFAALASLSLTARAAFVLTSPAKGATVSPLKPMQRAMSLMTEEQLDLLLNQETVERMAVMTTYPAGVQIAWKGAPKGTAGYEVVVAQDAELTVAPRKSTTAETAMTIYNLEIGRMYFVRANALDAAGNTIQSTAIQSFTVDGTTPRVMYIPGVPNVRDLGGRTGLEGRIIPQGMIFRSAAFNDNSPDGGKTPGKTRMTKESLAIEREAMHIRTELDLRWDSELADMAASPLGPEVQYLRMPSTLYSGLFTEQGYENYRELFTVFTKPENYPIDFHCILGADRTGSLALVLLATLGVSREEIIRDYAFTSLYDGFLRPPRNIAQVFDGLANCGREGDALSDQAMRYLLRCGVKGSQIYDFLTIVLGEGLACPEVLKEAKLIEELQERYSKPLEALAVEPFAMREERMLQCGKEVEWSLPVWKESPLKSGGTDGLGNYHLRLCNTQAIATTFRLQPQAALTAPEYFVLDPLNRTAYCAPNGGMRWKPDELADFHRALAPQEELNLVILQPAPDALDGFDALPWTALPEYYPLFATAATIQEPPVLDGELEDEAWQTQAPYLLSGLRGESVENAPEIWLATNEAHDILYLAARLQDDTPCAEPHAQRDAGLWNEDSIEVFLASHRDAKTYQIILSAAGAVWDGIVGDANENAWTADCRVQAVQTEGGWTLEAAIPLAQFDFAGALELNVCANNNPGAYHLNLFPTFGAFRERSAICPVLFK